MRYIPNHLKPLNCFIWETDNVVHRNPSLPSSCQMSPSSIFNSVSCSVTTVSMIKLSPRCSNVPIILHNLNIKGLGFCLKLLLCWSFSEWFGTLSLSFSLGWEHWSRELNKIHSHSNWNDEKGSVNCWTDVILCVAHTQYIFSLLCNCYEL